MYECEDCGQPDPTVRLRGSGQRLCDTCETEHTRAVGMSVAALLDLDEVPADPYAALGASLRRLADHEQAERDANEELPF